MKLYYAPGACSLADHIALIESGLPYETEHVDLRSRITAGGADFRLINPKGYVPALEMDDGEILTENIAILSYIAAESGWLSPPDGPIHWRVLEMTAYISTEIHKHFKLLFDPSADPEQQAKTRKLLTQTFNRLAGDMGDTTCLFGEHPMIADCYLFVMLMWARGKAGVHLPARLNTYFDHLCKRPSVRQALEDEGLDMS
ncbi:MAG: glutathione S-transferase N-terminal domain-containing protein [Sphingomonadales bacterium]|nr:glutathione S-transferase N-terminal domain-containing protein [Sphingomonadales bacterium]MDE2170639.1 glutathione S-transferase N-terminal domain-containing protein [Sphingomonadales bacterium]